MFIVRDHTRPTTFHRGSNVLEYWLANAEGFRVASPLGARHRVEYVLVDPRRGTAQALVIRRSGTGRRRTLPAPAISAVDPFDRVLHLEGDRPSVAAVGLTRRFVAAVASLQPHLRSLARSGGVALLAIALGVAAVGRRLRSLASTWAAHGVREAASRDAAARADSRSSARKRGQPRRPGGRVARRTG